MSSHRQPPQTTKRCPQSRGAGRGGGACALEMSHCGYPSGFTALREGIVNSHIVQNLHSPPTQSSSAPPPHRQRPSGMARYAAIRAGSARLLTTVFIPRSVESL